MKNCGYTNIYDEGYKVAFAIALENLKNGLTVIADSTNPVIESRTAWVEVANKASCSYKEIEIICSNKAEHRQRVESRKTDIPRLVLPTWQSVTSREYAPWTSANIVLDTAGKTPEQSKQELMQFCLSN